jgi:deoxyribodipyrimidine photo-lyase
MTTAIWWLRRDLRLADNPALAYALNSAASVVPAFILDDRLLNSRYAGERRIAFLFEGLRQLNQDLLARGSRLIVRRGLPEIEIARLRDEVEATVVVAQQDCSPYAMRRDRVIAESVPLTLVEGLAALPLGSVRKENGEPYTVFTPFSRRWKARWRESMPALLPAPGRIDTPPSIHSDALPNAPLLARSDAPYVAGEKVARQKLRAFVAPDGPIFSYKDRRDRPDLDATSRLSPYLRFGMLSPRAAATAATEAIDMAEDERARTSAETWLNELIWRDFYLNTMAVFPYVRRESFRTETRAIAWHNDASEFEAWRTGRTGYPFIDAAMRQLAATGWMHNRARMAVASFLVKDLLIDWRWGERWFMQQLIDGDPAPNNGGWQWTAGTGTDAAPYFRIFNPVSQGRKFDPQGVYVRRWVPELRQAPDEFIHEPWKMPQAIQAVTGCIIGQDYPTPIVDHGWARERTLHAYQSVRTAP